jgi:hypothetical protein
VLTICSLCTATSPHTLGEEERERRGIKPLPGSLKESLANLKADKVLTDAMGEKLVQLYFVGIVVRFSVGAGLTSMPYSLLKILPHVRFPHRFTGSEGV